MPRLAPERQRIVRAIKREGRKIRDPRVRRIYENAAIQTGLVESGLTNPSGGDADSAGWRQERRSLYPNPTNVAASVRRFRQEFEQQYDPGEHSYEVAAQVQRPAARFRGRYQEMAPEARAILGRGRVGRESASGARLRITQSPGSYTPGVNNADLRRDLKLQYLEQRHNPNALLDLKSSLENAQDVAPSYKPGKTTITSSSKPAPKVARSSEADAIEAEANLIDAAKTGYQWGGGHAKRILRGSKVTPLDCSGAVSRVLGVNPRVSGEFATWGKPGKGRRVTIYSNQDHVLMSIRDKRGVEHFWGTSQTNPGGGPGWIPRSKVSKKYLSRFAARHPEGL